MQVVADVDGVLDGVAVSAARVPRRQRAPTDDFAVVGGDDDGVARAVGVEPAAAGVGGLVLFGIGAGRSFNIVVINVVDGVQVGDRGRAELDVELHGTCAPG